MCIEFDTLELILGIAFIVPVALLLWGYAIYMLRAALGI